MVDSRGCVADEPGAGGGRGGAAVDGPACEGATAPEGRLACCEGGGRLDESAVVGTPWFAGVGRGCCCDCELALGRPCDAVAGGSCVWFDVGIRRSG